MSAVCPHCAFTQEESAHAKSTFCRKCGQHYNLERALAGEQSIVKEEGFLQKWARKLMGDKEREIGCFTCAHRQIVTSAYQNTMCAACGAYIDLRDFKILTPFGRSIQTGGEVIIGEKGDVSSTKIMCGSALIEGRLRGYMICTGTLTIKRKGAVTGGIESETLVIAKRADVDFSRTIKTRIFEVSGRAHARVIAEKVIIHKGGYVDGAIYARSIIVDKGGVFSGELFIGHDNAVAAEESVNLQSLDNEEEATPSSQSRSKADDDDDEPQLGLL